MAKYEMTATKPKTTQSSVSIVNRLFKNRNRLGLPSYITTDSIVCTEKPEVEYSIYLQPENIDVANLKESDREKLFEKFWSFHKEYPYSIKERFLSFVENNKAQQSFIEFKLQGESNLVKIKWLKEELEQLKFLEREYKSYQSSFVIFAPTIEELNDRVVQFKQAIADVMAVKPFTPKDTIILLRMISNVGEQITPAFEATELIGQENQRAFQAFIQPQGGVSFKNESYLRFGDSYRTCIHLVDRSNEVQWYWVNQIARTEGVDSTLIDYFCDVSVDYEETTSDSSEFKQFEKRNSRKFKDADKSATEEALLKTTSRMITQTGERIKYVSIRLFVSAETLSELERKVNEINRKVNKKFTPEVLLNLQEAEFNSQFISYENQLRTGLKSHSTIEMPCEAIRQGFGHNRIELKDPCGFFAGVTSTGGTFYFDGFRKTSTRKAYDMFVSGMKGSGKSTILKKTAKMNYAFGNRVFIFDKGREWAPLAKEAGGITFSLDGSSGMINMLQVFPLKTKEIEGKALVDVNLSFQHHLEQTAKRLRIFSADSSDANEETYVDILFDFYVSLGLFGEKAKVKDITNLPNELYPTFVELQYFVKEKLKANQFEKELYRESYDKMDTLISKIVKQYPHILVGTTTFTDLVNQSFVVFDISMLSHDRVGVYDCIYDLVLNLTISTAMKTGREEFLAYNTGLKDFRSIRRSVIINDECHNTLNILKPAIIETFASLSSEGRKVFIGTIHATQEIHEMLPAGTNINNGREVKAVTGLKKILGLVDYLWLLKQSSTSTPIIKEYFGSYFVDSDYEAMERFETDEKRGAQLKFVMSGSRPVDIWFRVRRQELRVFGGGA